MDIRFEINPRPLPSAEKVLQLYKDSGVFSQGWTVDRMTRSLQGSSVVVCAWHGDELIGLAKAVSDFAWFAFLNQLAVSPAFQKQGIGTKLVKCLRETLGPDTCLLVHSADRATKFYETLGFKPYPNVLRIDRADQG